MRSSRGFTLIELLIVMAILGIIAVFAVPSFNSLIANQRLNTMRDGLVSAIQLARGEALSRNRAVSVCPANAAGTACIATNDWSQGFLVFQDDNAAGWSAGEEIIRHWPAATGVVSDAGDVSPIIRFRPQGVASQGSGQTISFCDVKSAVPNKTLEIAVTTGFARTGPQTPAGC